MARTSFEIPNITESTSKFPAMVVEDRDDCTARPLMHSDPPYRLRQEDFFKLPKELRNLLAGGIAGMVAKSFVAPIDRIKILYQVTSREFHLRDIPRVGYRIITEEGMAALWKGNVATMIRVFPYSGIQFMVFDRCKTFFLHQQSTEEQERIRREAVKNTSKAFGMTPLQSLLSGSLAGAVSVLATYPLDLTRAQLAVIKKKKQQHNLGFAGLMAKNYAEKGFHGLFRGILPTMLGILPYSGVAFALNEQGKRKIQHLTGRPVTTIEKMQCGALSGLVAQTLTYPLEVTRRRMQTLSIVQGKDAAVSVLGMNTGAAASSPRQTTMAWTMRELYLEQGIRGFFKGVSMNWIKGPVAFSISFTTFDTVQDWMMTDEERRLRQPKKKV